MTLSELVHQLDEQISVEEARIERKIMSAHRDGETLGNDYWMPLWKLKEKRRVAVAIIEATQSALAG